MANPAEVTIPVRLQFRVPIVGVVESPQQQSNFDDVGDFHRKFILPAYPDSSQPRLLDEQTQAYRSGFLEEELTEFKDAWANGDLEGAFDALLDLTYVAMGTAHMMGLPWQAGWDEVQRANMTKVRATSADESAQSTGRGSLLDVIKPEGWVPPDIAGVLAGGNT